jgi:hypothetical protein
MQKQTAHFEHLDINYVQKEAIRNSVAHLLPGACWIQENVTTEEAIRRKENDVVFLNQLRSISEDLLSVCEAQLTRMSYCMQFFNLKNTTIDNS